MDNKINYKVGALVNGLTFAKNGASAYGTFIIFGFVQGIGAIAIALTINEGAVNKIKNLLTFADWTETEKMTFSYDSSSRLLTIGGISTINSYITVISS